MSDLVVITPDYDVPRIDLSLLQHSCATHKLTLRTYGAGKSWPGFCGGKIRDACEFLKTRSEPYALFTDGQDSFFVHTAPTQPTLEKEIISTFLTLAPENKILISCEKSCWPDMEVAARYYANATPWCYINAGGWMGGRLQLIAALEEMQKLPDYARGDDQRVWHSWYLQDPNRAVLDMTCEIFQSMANTNEIDYEGQNTVTGSYPVCYHANGRCMTMDQMEEMRRRLG